MGKRDDLYPDPLGALKPGKPYSRNGEETTLTPGRPGIRPPAAARP